jgi:hypothetical protein
VNFTRNQDLSTATDIKLNETNRLGRNDSFFDQNLFAVQENTFADQQRRLLAGN